MNLSYNISEHLNTYLTKIEKLKIDILTIPLSPKNELRLKWDANLERILWALALTNNPLTKKDVINGKQKDVVALKEAVNYIKENWTVNNSPVTISTIKKLYDISCKKTLGPMSGLTEYAEKRINTILEYLQRGQDHPLIQAGLIQSEIINITPFDNGNGRIARLLSYLFLYKNGYDFRGMLIVEEYYKRDVVSYKRMLEASKIQGNMTVWLEYFTYGVGVSLEKYLDIIKDLKFQEEMPSAFWKLNARQKEITEKLEDPSQKITNREVQKLFEISQITASRDLAHLTNLGLLFSHGKGRSVYYTKV